MRVLMLNNEFPPLGGGTGTVNHALLGRFAEIPNLEIDLVTSALGRRPEVEAFAEQIQIYKVPVSNRNIHHSSGRELATYAVRALPCALRLHRERPYDLTFAWSTVPAGPLALALRKRTGLPYLIRVCGPDLPGFEQRYRRLYPLLTPLIRAVLEGATVVVAKCEREAEMIRTVSRRVAVTLIPNGVDSDRFQPATSRESGQSLRLICVGRLIERKGQSYLIEAIKHLSDTGVDVTLSLVGTGDAEERYREQVHGLGISDRVEFCGYVPREEMPACYASADVFVLPSYNEGMSVATLEAMAAGLPVVVTRTGGTAELIDEGANGLTFDWADISGLVSHLTELNTNRDRLAEMGKAARKKAEAFSWTLPAQQYLDLLGAIGVATAPARVYA